MLSADARKLNFTLKCSTPTWLVYLRTSSAMPRRIVSPQTAEWKALSASFLAILCDLSMSRMTENYVYLSKCRQNLSVIRGQWRCMQCHEKRFAVTHGIHCKILFVANMKLSWPIFSWWLKRTNGNPLLSQLSDKTKLSLPCTSCDRIGDYLRLAWLDMQTGAALLQQRFCLKEKPENYQNFCKMPSRQNMPNVTNRATREVRRNN